MLHVAVCFESCQHLDCSDLVAGILCSRVKQWQVRILKEMLLKNLFQEMQATEMTLTEWRWQSDVDGTEIGVILWHYLLCDNWGRAKVAQHTATSQTMLPKITKVLIHEKCITCKILALWYAGIVPSLTNSHLSVFCSHQNGLEQIPLSAWKKKKYIYIYIYTDSSVQSHSQTICI